MSACTKGPAVLKFAEQSFTDSLREFRIDVSDRLPGGFIELHWADDRVAEEQCPVAPGGHDYAEMSRSVSRCHGESDARRDGGVAADRSEISATVGGSAEPLSDMVKHPHLGVCDEVVPVMGAEPDGGVREDRKGVMVEEPAAMVGVQMGAYNVGNVRRRDTDCAESEQKLAADKESACPVVAHLRSHTGVDKDGSVPSAYEEAADGQPGQPMAGEEVLVALKTGVGSEVGRRGPKGPVGDGVNINVADQH
ncbi:hypothetical protein WKI58_38400 [Streptomyces halotolerans]|uniref:Uncharacterized protein n=1 Tax=Streptomyces pratisoli TaxID=3139917 RepID=A0ACC6QVD4_9ACTN